MSVTRMMIAVVALVATPITLAAQDLAGGYSQCARALVPDNTSLQSNDSIRLSWLATLDSERFEETRRNLDTGGSVLVDGIPIAGHANYGEFSKSRDREFRSTDFRYSRDQAIEFLQTKLSQGSLDAWVKCLELQASQQDGLRLIPVKFGPGFVDVRIRWNVPNTDAVFSTAWFTNTPDPGAVLVSGASLPQNFPKTIKPAGTWEGSFAWDGKQPFYLALNTKQRAASLRLLPAPSLKKASGTGSCQPPASEGDLGYGETRSMHDLDGDGCSDFCRITGVNGAFRLLCTFAKREAVPQRSKVDIPLPQQVGERYFSWADVSRESKPALCQVNGSGATVYCSPVTLTGLGAAASYGPVADAGYPQTQRWIDFNGDGELDLCRQVGTSQPYEVCTPQRKGRLYDGETSRYK